MHTHALLAAFAAAALALAGCSSSSSSDAGADPGLSTPAAGRPYYDTVEELAGDVGCTKMAEPDSQELYVKEHTTCTPDGSTAELALYVFADDAARDDYLEAATHFGGAYGKGPGWVVSGDTVAAVRTAVQPLGGTVL